MNEPSTADPDALAAAVAAWRGLGDRYAAQLKGQKAGAPLERARQVGLLLELGDLRGALLVMLSWLQLAIAALPERGQPRELLDPVLLRALADVAERTSDQQLIELFWRALGRLKLPQSAPGTWPLVGVPVLNRPDLLERLIASFDCPVGTLAIVDNSGGRSDAEALALRALLESLERQGHADIGRIRVARAFGNAGVAAAWNQILLGFPEAPVALILNNDIQMA
ncbi:MAG: hypothetical protein WBM08_09085, partial [Prochlorococcaceae cyanobacterium]